MKSRIRQKRAAHSQTKAAQEVKIPASIADQGRPRKMRYTRALTLQFRVSDATRFPKKGVELPVNNQTTTSLRRERPLKVMASIIPAAFRTFSRLIWGI